MSDIQSLQELASIHQELVGVRGYLASMATINNPGNQGGGVVSKPWIDEPEGSIPFDEQNGIALPIVGSGDVNVLAVSIPLGYDGVIKMISNNFLGGGFTDFSGEIIWRIQADGRPIRNFSNIQAEKGTPGIQRIISPIRVYSGQTITYVVNHIANIALNGNVVCSLTGYIYPSRQQG